MKITKNKFGIILIFSLLLIVIAITYIFANGFFDNKYRIVMRTERNPIISRFPKLGNFEKCFWTGEEIKSSVRIGPTNYKMKGLVLLDKHIFIRFRDGFKWNDQPEDWHPNLDTNILKKSQYQWAFSDDFNSYIHTNTYVGNFYMDLVNGIIYFEIET